MIILYELFFWSSLASAATVETLLSNAAGNTTILNTEAAPPWADSPSFRGTSDILWSCIVTITACVYTALHLNVPSSHKSKWRLLGTKVKWALIALFAPELVLYTAYNQFYAARQLCKSLNDMRGATQRNKDNGVTSEEAQLNDLNIPKNFDLTYGFWVVMGGFVVDTSSIHDTFLQVTLTPLGVELLAREGLFLEMSNDQIADRSKANILAKSLVCIQITWMLIQCAARKSAGYPLTLLEIHTMVHVVCALCIYGLWWHKPLDVQEPVLVNTIAYMDTIALMLMASNITESQEEVKSELRRLQMYPNESSRTITNTPVDTVSQRRIPSATDIGMIQSELTPEQHQLEETDESAVKPRIIRHYDFKGTIKPRISSKGTKEFSESNAIASLQPGESLLCGLGPRDYDSDWGTEVTLSFKDIRRWELATDALKKLGSPTNTDDKLVIYRGTWVWRRKSGPEIESGVVFDAPNGVSILGTNEEYAFPGLSTYDKVHYTMTDRSIVFYSSFLAPLTYGGIHLTAWGLIFPSTTEGILWKLSSIGIMGAFPLDLVLNFFCYCVVWISGLDVYITLPAYVFWPLSVFYAFCRVYIVVEAFLSLRHVSLGAYAAVPWVQSIPHL